MPNRQDHDRAGAIFGAGTAALSAWGANEDELDILIETIGGLFGGVAGSRLPDIFDPAYSPNHRSLGHGVVPAGGSLMYCADQLPDWQNRLRNNSRCFMEDYRNDGDGFDLLMALLCRFASGVAAGAVAGNASHLVMDAQTPRGLPVFS